MKRIDLNASQAEYTEKYPAAKGVEDSLIQNGKSPNSCVIVPNHPLRAMYLLWVKFDYTQGGKGISCPKLC